MVALVVLAGVSSGGMRSITFVQAFQYWLKLTALLIPAMVLLVVWLGDGAPDPRRRRRSRGCTAPTCGRCRSADGGGQGLYVTYSLIIATFLGTMGLPHVVVRFYTNPDGRAARRTTLVVLVLLGAFYLLPPVYGALGRIYASDLAAGGGREVLVLELPRLMVPGLLGDLLTGLVTAGAFAAFLSTSSGLSDRGGRACSARTSPAAGGAAGGFSGVTAFRVGAVVAVLVPCLVSLPSPEVGVARTVGLAFAVAASTFCPLLLLGIWWRGLTAAGAVAGLLVGGLGSGAAVVWTIATATTSGWAAVLLGQPAAWSVPAALATMIVVSRLTRDRRPSHADRFMVRLHTPEAVELDRGWTASPGRPLVVRDRPLGDDPPLAGRPTRPPRRSAIQPMPP